MAHSEVLQEWAWLIAVALAFGFVGLLLGIKRLQAYQARKRAAPDEGDVSETYANFQRARRNFFVLIVVFVVGLVAIEIWNLYFYLERPTPVR